MYLKLVVCQVMLQAGLSRGLVPAVPCAIIAIEAQKVSGCTHVQSSWEDAFDRLDNLRCSLRATLLASSIVYGVHFSILMLLKVDTAH